VVVVRPRGLDWDLLPLNPNDNGGPRFWEAARIEAQDVAQRLYRALEASATDGDGARVDAVAASTGYEVRIAVGSFVLLACGRIPGRPYEPHLFDTVTEALAAVDQIRACLNPTAAVVQEVYLNTRNFAGQT
jgi:hypothetical protein